MIKRNASIAKISRPRLTSVFPGERIFTLLDTGRNSQVVWIAGQPGTGKTTLAASYLDARKHSYLWYHVDEGDTDIATFFRYMGIAVKMAFPCLRKGILKRCSAGSSHHLLLSLTTIRRCRLIQYFTP